MHGMYICSRCSYEGPKAKLKRGSTKMEIFLWTVLLIPGPFYTAWRMCTKYWGCPECRETIMVPMRNKIEIQADRVGAMEEVRPVVPAPRLENTAPVAEKPEEPVAPKPRSGEVIW